VTRLPERGAGAARRMRAVIICGLAGAVAVTAVLATDARKDRSARNDPEAVRLLRAAADAALRVRYEGSQFLTTWSGSETATQRIRVEHAPGDGTYFSPETGAPPAPTSRGASGGAAESAPGARDIPVGDGGFESQTRPGTVRTYQPDNLPVWNGAVGFTSEILGLLIRNYRVVRGPQAAICGRDARVVEARRADGSTAGRFWIDSETGLMLHRELMDARGRAVSSTGFSRLRVAGDTSGGEPMTMTATQPPERRRGAAASAAVPWADRLDGTELAVLRDQGWPVPGDLPGRLTLYDARRPASGQRTDPKTGRRAGRKPEAVPGGIVHLSYSDGLAAVSVFVQRGTLDESRFKGWRRMTARGRTVFRRDSLQHWAVWARDGYVYTVLTDAPPETTDTVVQALPPGEDALRARMGRGFRRLLSWVNPFG
jgi:hypothetical protein